MRRRKDALFAAGMLAIIVVVLALGFQRLGPRGHQRAIAADIHRINDLQAIARLIASRYGSQPPAALADVQQIQPAHLSDPVTRTPYEYRLKSGTTYELCATFATASEDNDEQWPQLSHFWWHRKGRFCYQLDSSKTPE